MKFSLLGFALFSTTVFAIGVNDLTGASDPILKTPKTNLDMAYLNGASTKETVDKSRMPASQAEEKVLPQYTELTGTFE